MSGAGGLYDVDAGADAWDGGAPPRLWRAQQPVLLGARRPGRQRVLSFHLLSLILGDLFIHSYSKTQCVI